MPRLSLLFSILFLLALIGSALDPLYAQNKDYHSFTDKKSQTIEAALVTVSIDKSKVTIERKKDGGKFEIPILTLSLNDQQYIKNWLITHPIESSYNIEFSLSKHNTSSERIKRLAGERAITQKFIYELEFKNLSREVLKGATLEYYVITVHGLYVYPDSETGEPIWIANVLPPKRDRKKNLTKFKQPISIKHSKQKLDDLAYNFAATIKSEELQLREIILDGGDVFAADKIGGLIARLTDASGQEIGIFRSNDTAVQSMPWERISKLPPGDPSGVATAPPIPAP